MHIHILGICGTFMGSLAKLAKESGHQVSGMDKACYPPMSSQLEQAGISVISGYDPKQIPGAPDIYVIGNALSRGNPVVEHILEQGLPYTSGPEWMASELLKSRWVLAVSGTHGKSTTACMLAWILEFAGLNPGFLIGAVPENFAVSSRLGESEFFVIEADEYDTAFFDKRPKHLHYHPRTLIMTNLEYDHADIYPDIDAIITQFHYLLRTVPANGLVVAADNDSNLSQAIKLGCWTDVCSFDVNAGDFSAQLLKSDGSEFLVKHHGEAVGHLHWELIGLHNVNNALAAIAASKHVGVAPSQAIAALAEFKGVKRRLSLRAKVNDMTVYEDFAHHPTAIKTTLTGMRERVGQERLLAVVDLASNSMAAGVHNHALANAFTAADKVYFLIPKDKKSLFTPMLQAIPKPVASAATTDALAGIIGKDAIANDHILLMSNKDITPLINDLTEELRQ